MAFQWFLKMARHVRLIKIEHVFDGWQVSLYVQQCCLGFLKRFSPQNRMEWGWDWQSADQLWKRMGAGFQLHLRILTDPSFRLFYQQ
jgi:hypothetical protein